MDRRRRRGHGSATAVAAGVALVSFWIVSGLSGAGAVEVEAPVPTITILAVRNGEFAVNTPACSSTSSTALGAAELEVRRNGLLAGDLTVHYGVNAESVEDYEPLSGSVTIPDGSATASIGVVPRFADRPPPVHVHRSAPITGRLFDDAAYDVEGEGTATVTLRFDVDIEGCAPPAPPPTSPPAAPTGSPPAPAPEVRPATATNPAASSPPAELPFTGSAFTTALGGIGTALVALGGLSLRYGRPRERRRRPRI
jgi:hypothetical protein